MQFTGHDISLELHITKSSWPSYDDHIGENSSGLGVI